VGVGDSSSGSKPELAVDSLPEGQPVSNASICISGAACRKVIMSMVLDRSGSMISDGGAMAIQSAVPTFISLFNNSFDEVALLSFSSNARIDFPIGYNFITPIINSVANMQFAGGTFGTGTGDQPILIPTIGAPMSLADLQNNSVVINPGQQVVKVLVYFTDGLMNTVQDSFFCPNQVLINYGGYDTGRDVGFFDPTCSPDASGNGCTNESGHVSQWGTCTNGCPNGFPYDANGDICRNAQGQLVTTFLSQQTGQETPFVRANVTAESQYRAIYTANAMRTESPVPTYIYTIGLGISVSPTTQAFLAQLANDPRYPTYIPGQPAGEFFYIANCPSPNCTVELEEAFQAIASELLR
jgi:von Willebrand factor type A domain